MAWRSSSGVDGSRFLKRQQLGSPLFLHVQRSPAHFCWSSLLPLAAGKRLKLLLTIVAIILTTAIISHPFILFQWYNNNNNHHNVQQQHSFVSSATKHPPPNKTSRSNKLVLADRHQNDENNDTDDNLLLLRPGCLTEACIHATAATFLTRTYPNRTDQRWCRKEAAAATTASLSSAKDIRNAFVSHNNQGILLVKVPKGASSTAAGVAIRIARRHHCDTKTGLQWRHQPAFNSTFARRSRHDSFLFTTIRDPAHRAVSSIFFHVVSRILPNSNKNNTSSAVSDAFLLQYLQQHTHPHHGAISQPGQGGFQLRYMSIEEIVVPPVVDNVDDPSWKRNNASTLERAGVVVNPELMVQRVQDTMNAYDFILVTERMEESLVAMSILMGISVGDVLVTASKVAGSNYHLAHLPGNVFKCIKTVKSVILPTVQAYLESDAWRAANYGDYLLHHAANLSLDRTISQIIGHGTFQRALQEYQLLRALEQAKCAPHVHFPCSNDGVPQPERSKKSCYLPFFDFGCGHACIDDIIQQQQQQEGAIEVHLSNSSSFFPLA